MTHTGVAVAPDEAPMRFLLATAWVFVLTSPFMRAPVAALPALMLIAALPVTLTFRSRTIVPWPVLWLAILAAYQLCSALAFGMPASNLATFDFIRRDAKFYIAYLPLVATAFMRLDYRHVERMLKVLTVLVACIALLGVIEYALAMAGLRLRLQVTFSPRGHFFLTGLARSHNAVGGFYAVVLAFAYGQILADSWRGLRWWIAISLIGVAMILTLSRAAILGFGTIALMTTFAWGSRRTLLAAGAAVVLALPLAGGGLIDRITELRQPEEVYNIAVRFQYWLRAADYIQGSPILGVGYSRFNDEPVAELAGTPGLLQWKVDPPIVNNDAHAHNAILMAWAETGILGVCLWAAFLLSLAHRARQLYLDADEPPAVRGLAYGVIMAFGIILVASMVSNNIVTPSGVWVPAFFAGTLLGLAPRARLVALSNQESST